jgi:hypothetical protein
MPSKTSASRKPYVACWCSNRRSGLSKGPNCIAAFCSLSVPTGHLQIVTSTWSLRHIRATAQCPPLVARAMAPIAGATASHSPIVTTIEVI